MKNLLKFKNGITDKIFEKMSCGKCNILYKTIHTNRDAKQAIRKAAPRKDLCGKTSREGRKRLCWF